MQVRDSVWSPSTAWSYEASPNPWLRFGAAAAIGFLAGRSRTARAIARGAIVAIGSAMLRELVSRQLA